MARTLCALSTCQGVVLLALALALALAPCDAQLTRSCHTCAACEWQCSVGCGGAQNVARWECSASQSAAHNISAVCDCALPAGAVTAIVFGALAALGIAVALFWCWRNRRRALSVNAGEELAPNALEADGALPAHVRSAYSYSAVSKRAPTDASDAEALLSAQ